jgi:hypothetical protein
MRKLFTLVILLNLFSIFKVQSQVVSKKDKLFGGSFSFAATSFNIQGSNNGAVGNTQINPSFSWAIKDNVVLGLKGSISYSHSVSKNNLAEKSVSNSFGLGPGIFIKKYKPVKNKFGIYFDHSANMNYSVVKSKSPPAYDVAKSHTWGVSYNFSPGIFYKFSDSFFGEANIGGIYGSYYNNGANNFVIAASFLQYFNIGINYRIPRKKIS